MVDISNRITTHNGVVTYEFSGVILSGGFGVTAQGRSVYFANPSCEPRHELRTDLYRINPGSIQ